MPIGSNSALPRERPRTHAEINEYRRRALLEGAIRSFAEHGVAGTTNRTICEAAGVSSGLIQHYFESKEKLVAAAFTHLFESFAAAVAERVDAAGPTAADRLRALPRAILSPDLATDEVRNAFLTFWHEIRFNELVRAENKEFYAGYMARMRTLFEEAAAERGRPADADRATKGLVCLLDGLWLNLTMAKPVLSAREADAICQRYIDHELGGEPV